MNRHERRQQKGLQGPGERGWNQLGKSPEKKAETPEKTGRDGISSRCREDRVYPTPREEGRMRRLTEWSKQKALLAPEGGVLLCGVRRRGHQRGDVSVDTGEQGVQHSGERERGQVGEREKKKKQSQHISTKKN